MSIQARAVQCSLLIHCTLFTGLVLAGLLPAKQPPPLVIDLSLNLAGVGTGEPAASPGSDSPSPPGASDPQSRAVESSPPLPAPTREIAPSPKKSIPRTPKLQKKRPAPPPHVVKEPTPIAPARPLPPPAAAAADNISTATGSATLSPSAGAGLAQSKAGAGTDHDPGDGSRGEGGGMRDDFTYVRERILHNLRFPAIARQKGQTGEIVVAFNLLADGQVEGMVIVSGSGHDILDQCVLDTIRRVSPFPRPPTSAHLVLPIVFHLK